MATRRNLSVSEVLDLLADDEGDGDDDFCGYIDEEDHLAMAEEVQSDEVGEEWSGELVEGESEEAVDVEQSEEAVDEAQNEAGEQESDANETEPMEVESQ